MHGDDRVPGGKLSRYWDILAGKTGLGRAWIGVVLMASVTSLPELITGLGSVLRVISICGQTPSGAPPCAAATMEPERGCAFSLKTRSSPTTAWTGATGATIFS